MERYNEKSIQRQGLPDNIPTTDEAERSELPEQIDKLVVGDHLSADNALPNAEEEESEPGSPS